MVRLRQNKVDDLALCRREVRVCVVLYSYATSIVSGGGVCVAVLGAGFEFFAGAGGLEREGLVRMGGEERKGGRDGEGGGRHGREREIGRRGRRRRDVRGRVGR